MLNDLYMKFFFLVLNLSVQAPEEHNWINGCWSYETKMVLHTHTHTHPFKQPQNIWKGKNEDQTNLEQILNFKSNNS